jgi:hypothetical protein
MKEPHEIALQIADKRPKFKHQGRSIHGCDCAGLIFLVAQERRIQTKDPGVYSREPSNGLLRDWLLANGCQEVEREPEVDDILLIQLRGQAEAGHLAIVVPHPEGLGIVHSYYSARRVVFQHLDATRRDEIRGIFLWPDKV